MYQYIYSFNFPFIGFYNFQPAIFDRFFRKPIIGWICCIKLSQKLQKLTSRDLNRSTHINTLVYISCIQQNHRIKRYRRKYQILIAETSAEVTLPIAL